MDKGQSAAPRLSAIVWLSSMMLISLLCTTAGSGVRVDWEGWSWDGRRHGASRRRMIDTMAVQGESDMGH